LAQPGQASGFVDGDGEIHGRACFIWLPPCESGESGAACPRRGRD
jgi:hypothetical protein